MGLNRSFTRAAGLVMLAWLGLLGCGDDDDQPGPTSKREWQEVFDDLPGALISVSGTSDRDVWAVGGNPGDGSGAFVLHYDGQAFSRLTPPAGDADLWWVHPLSDGTVFVGGTLGTIARSQGSSFELLPTPADDVTVFGIWGTSAQDLWAVGGDPTAMGKAFVWRFDGASWRVAEGLPQAKVRSYFKVWGRSASEVRIVGMDGVILHYDGQAFSEAPSPTIRRLLTLHVQEQGPWVAVGGQSNAVVLEDSGGGWQDVSPEGQRAQVGVRLQGEVGFSVGSNGSVLARKNGAWQGEDTGIDVFGDFHAVWIDPAGGAWAVGGDILSAPLVSGVMLYKGPDSLPTSYQ